MVWQPDGFSGWHSLILSARVAEFLLAHRSIDQAKHGSNRKCTVPISRPCLSQQGKDKMAAGKIAWIECQVLQLQVQLNDERSHQDQKA